MALTLAPLALVSGVSAAAQHRYVGETYTCHFPRVGTVVIDTREPGSSITVNGKRYAATGGADHYVTPDGDIIVMFMPYMRTWEWQARGPWVACPKRRNRR